MKTKTINLYSFDELSEEAKKKAIQNLSDINVDYQWWGSTYEDAKNIGLFINGFDLDRNKHAKGYFINPAYECANDIVREHGKDCDTHKTAVDFIAKWDKAVTDHSDGIDTERVCEEKESDFDAIADDLESEFLKSILSDYATILQNEYEHLTSKEAIIETIKANDYTFTKNGKLENL